MENFAVDISGYKKQKFDRGIPEIFGHNCWEIDKTPLQHLEKKVVGFQFWKRQYSGRCLVWGKSGLGF